jgi:hypothetical protein
MPNAFDPYREALVVETTTLWPDEFEALEPADRRKVEEHLHADPAQAVELEYVRVHTGFQRQVTVTPAEVERLIPRAGAPSP